MNESQFMAAGPAGRVPVLRRSWRTPTLEELPTLERLTLQSPIVGGEGGFSWLDLTNTPSRLG